MTYKPGLDPFAVKYHTSQSFDRTPISGLPTDNRGATMVRHVVGELAELCSRAAVRLTGDFLGPESIPNRREQNSVQSFRAGTTSVTGLKTTRSPTGRRPVSGSEISQWGVVVLQQ
jgi:hypothetical protein